MIAEGTVVSHQYDSQRIVIGYLQRETIKNMPVKSKNSKGSPASSPICLACRLDSICIAVAHRQL